ncbi:hypothetical protein B296_00024513 [Ensete ventricosum]|uniref:Uncharacterized protein n=1 Tax=Ensete ventricosum TaxID=4639 RepID=A0A426YFK1_ENSVE|nr:hypothetical protein B296_00024513 [Ensete ventricosum]
MPTERWHTCLAVKAAPAGKLPTGGGDHLWAGSLQGRLVMTRLLAGMVPRSSCQRPRVITDEAQ